MAQLTFTTRDVQDGEGNPATVVELAGSVDPASLEVFEGIFDELGDEEKMRIILDFGGLKYINSTGMGMMVQVNDTFTEDGGGIVLMNVTSKVMLLLEMLGLQELFTIVGTEDEALKALAGEEVGPTSVEVKLEGADDLPEVKSVEIEAAPASPRRSMTFHCPNCQAELAIPGPGAYRCPRCRSAVHVDGQGTVRAYPEVRSRCVEMALPPEDEYLKSASGLITAISKTSGLTGDEARMVAVSTQGCMKALADSCLAERNGSEQIHIFARCADDRVSIRLYCGGKGLQSDDCFAPFRDHVDQIQYTALPDGNLVSIVKRQG